MKYIVLAATIAALSCSKPVQTPVPQCRSNVFAWQGKLTSSGPASYRFGLLNKDASRLTNIAVNMQEIPVASQAAYNTAEHCYYVFASTLYSSKAVLLRISLDGTVSRFTDDSVSTGYAGLVFNSVTGKLYCFTNKSAGLADYGRIGEVVLSKSTFRITKLQKSNYNVAAVTSATVDQRDGIVYYAYHTPSDVIFEKWKPGDNKPKTILTGVADIRGLQSLQSDAGLLGLMYLPGKRKYQVYRFSATGFTFPSDTITGAFDSLLCSSCYDGCSGRFIVSSAIDSGSGIVRYFNTEGSHMRLDTTSGLILGMAAGN